MSEPIESRERRRPVWHALSDLFLDTELDEQHLAWIARILAESGYSDSELESILLREVYPVCLANLHDPAGVWSGFDEDSLEEEILRRAAGPRNEVGDRPKDFWMVETEWRTVLELLPDARRKTDKAGP